MRLQGAAHGSNTTSVPLDPSPLPWWPSSGKDCGWRVHADQGDRPRGKAVRPLLARAPGMQEQTGAVGNPLLSPALLLPPLLLKPEQRGHLSTAALNQDARCQQL